MQYLCEQDYAAVCDEFELEQIQGNVTIRQQAEQTAMEEVASYLRDRYDINAAYSRTGRRRNPKLVAVVRDVTLYHLIHRLPQQMGSDRRQELYDNAIQWCRDVQASKASPELPKYEDGTNTDTHNPVRWGCAIDKVSGVTW